MINITQFAPAFGLPNASPFALKLLTYLKMRNMPYQCDYSVASNKAPNGKFPVATINDKTLADSGIIIGYFESQNDKGLDDHLTPTEHAQALIIRRMLEEHLYWGLVYSRWQDEDFWPQTKPEFFKDLPKPLMWLIPNIVRKQTIKSLAGHGLGRHDKQTVYRLAIENIDAIATLLADRKYFFGDRPCSLDAALYAIFANFIYPTLATPLHEASRYHQNIVNYCDRIKTEYWVDSSPEKMANDTAMHIGALANMR